MWRLHFPDQKSLLVIMSLEISHIGYLQKKLNLIQSMELNVATKIFL